MNLCKVELSKICDKRGKLTIIENVKNIPFKIRRVYWINAVYNEIPLPEHACQNSERFIVCLSGSCEIIITNEKDKQKIVLDKPHLGVYIPQLTWLTISNFSSGAVCMIMSSELYSQDEYITEFLNTVSA